MAGRGLNPRGWRPTNQGAMHTLQQPTTPALSFVVEHCDIPADLTVAEWRRRCAAERRAERDAARAACGPVRRSLRRALRRG